MNITAVKSNLFKSGAQILIFGVFENQPVISGMIKDLDKDLGGIVAEEACAHNFNGKQDETLDMSVHSAFGAKRIMLLGLGERKCLNSEIVRRIGGAAAKTFKGKEYKSLAFFVKSCSRMISVREVARAFAEGVILAGYEFNKYKGKPKKEKIGVFDALLVVEATADEKQAQKGIAEARLNTAATLYARDLVNEPASICVPRHLAEHARNIAKESKGKIRVKIFGREEARAKGMGAFLAVAAGAAEEPYFIHLIYQPKKAKKKIVLVGKGITFDSGGLQTKPGESMATMKLDMAGAAAVLGIFSKITELVPRAEVHGVIAATENMPGPGAYKPGDICRAMNGKTIEIGHTDAEGRVTLADSLSYAAKLKPDAIIDLATLTGACMVALGEEITGLMSNNKKLAEKIKTSAGVTGERVWELPLAPEYKQLIKGTHADIKNSGSTRYGGAITAGLFLEEFVNGLPWAHLDIAGPAWAERETIPYIPLGGTGYGVRTMIEFLGNI